MQFCKEVEAYIWFLFFLKCFGTRNLKAASLYYKVLEMYEAN